MTYNKVIIYRSITCRILQYSLPLLGDQCKTDKSKYTFAQQVGNFQNSLPQEPGLTNKQIQKDIRDIHRQQVYILSRYKREQEMCPPTSPVE